MATRSIPEISVSAQAFTPGPWKRHDTADYAEIHPKVNGCPVALVARADDANLIAAAPDHALICWAMCVQDATWEEWDPNGKGEFCFAGLRYATQIDEFGAPVLTPALRGAIAKARSG